MTRISVCLTTYNSSKYIETQLNSILVQLSIDDELIISDDFSSDNTEEIIRSYNDPRIKFIKNKLSKGYTRNFENALINANGDIIFLSDHDDIWHEDKIKVTLELMKTNDFVVSDCRLINETGEEINSSFFSLRKPYKSIIGNIIKFGYLGCCMAFKRKILQKALPFPSKEELCTHDNWLFLIGIAYYKLAVSNDKLIDYRRHSTNVSTGGIKSATSLVFKLKYRLYLIVKLLSRLYI